MTHEKISEREQKKRLEMLIRHLKATGYLKSPEIEEAMRREPRHKYLPLSLQDVAYEDTPLPIGSGQTISAPHMVAMMLELLDVKPGMKVLEVGAGSGWNAALLSRLVGKDGLVVTIEADPVLYERARELLEKKKNLMVVHGDGSVGFEVEAPYDRIIVTCAAPEVPEELKEQLSPHGGVIVIPVGDLFSQELLRGERHGDLWDWTRHGYCRFVPMRGKRGFHHASEE